MENPYNSSLGTASLCWCGRVAAIYNEALLIKHLTVAQDHARFWRGPAAFWS